jgi:xylulokinase
MHHILAIDVGTTSLKGVLFDSHGRQLASCLQEYDLVKPAPDVVELDCEVYWDSACKVIRVILRESGIDPRQITSVGITSQGETLTVLDKDGRPLRRSIVWLDNRSRQEAEEIGRRFSIDEAYKITGQQEIIAAWTATRILWIRKHQPEIFQKAYKYLLVEDYLIYKLTGKYFTDRGLNPSTLYYDLTRGDWWPEMLQFLGITRQQLPELLNSGEVAGPVLAQAAIETGLCVNTMITTGPIDQIAGAVGAGNIEPGVLTETTGASLALCASVDRPIYDQKKRVGLYAHAMRGQFALLPWVPTAGMILRWFRDELSGERDYTSLCKEAQEISPGADGLTLLPHLNGAGCPFSNPKAKGVFWGMTLGHRRAHFVRAIMEAVAFMLRSNVELLEDLGVTIKEIRSLGGAAKSDLWLQIKADVCRKDLIVMQCQEAACLGVAMLSAVGSGLYGNLAEARNGMVQIGRNIRFNPQRADIYEEIYIRHLNLHNKIKFYY